MGGSTLDGRDIGLLLEHLDVDALPACPMCLFDAAWATYQGEPARRITGLITRTCNSTYDEIAPALRRQLVRLQNAGVAGAAEALADVDLRHRRSPVVRRVVTRLVADMAQEMATAPLPGDRRLCGP